MSDGYMAPSFLSYSTKPVIIFLTALTSQAAMQIFSKQTKGEGGLTDTADMSSVSFAIRPFGVNTFTNTTLNLVDLITIVSL